MHDFLAKGEKKVNKLTSDEKRLKKASSKFKKEYGSFKKTIDLGCGTGISGSAFKEYTDYIVGVDISNEMISIARKKNIYDELILGEINDAIQ